MASFEQHLSISVIVSGVTLIPLATSGMVSTTELFVLLGVGLIGGIMPDLDSDNSKPIQIAFKIFSITFSLFILLLLDDHFSLFQLLLGWIISSLIFYYGIFRTFTSLTVHRGIFHSIPMGIFLAQTTIILFYNFLNFNIRFATLAGFFIFFGIIIHLLLDELVSLNLLGISIKKSFGSALKLYDSKNITGTLILYILIILLFIYIPFDTDVLIDLANILYNAKIY